MNDRPLPLFPLPVVLFPGNPMPLHIFEPRYRSMVADLRAGDGRFGLIYHDPDEAGPFLNRTGQVGTVAEIREHRLLPDGRSLILVHGQERFAIREEVQGDTLYYQARVRELRDVQDGPTPDLLRRRRRSIDLFEQAMRAVPHVPETLPDLREDREVSFRLAGIVRMDPFWQQELLELRNEGARLDRLDPVFRAGMERWWEEGGSRA